MAHLKWVERKVATLDYEGVQRNAWKEKNRKRLSQLYW